MSESHSLDSVITEYRNVATIVATKNSGELSEEGLVGELASAHDWTEQGAQQFVALAQQYGSFILQNALALAIALEIEDGELGL